MVAPSFFRDCKEGTTLRWFRRVPLSLGLSRVCRVGRALCRLLRLQWCGWCLGVFGTFGARVAFDTTLTVAFLILRWRCCAKGTYSPSTPTCPKYRPSTGHIQAARYRQLRVSCPTLVMVHALSHAPLLPYYEALLTRTITHPCASSILCTHPRQVPVLQTSAVAVPHAHLRVSPIRPPIGCRRERR